MRTPLTLTIGVVVGALVSGGAAQAYWSNNSTGSGDGTATVSQGNNKPITIVLTSKTSGLEPGKSVTLAGKFNNPNSGYLNGAVTVHSVTVTTTGVDKPGCLASDFTLNKSTTAVNAVVPAGNGVGHWGGDITLTFRNDPKRDQSACHGATVRLHMTSD